MVASVLTALRTGELKGCHGHESSLKLKKTSLFSGSYKLATRFLVHLYWVTWLSPKKLGTQNKNSSAFPATSCLIAETTTPTSSTHSSFYLGEGNIWTHALSSLPSSVLVLFSGRSEGGSIGASEPCRWTFSCCRTQCPSAVTVSALLGGGGLCEFGRATVNGNASDMNSSQAAGRVRGEGKQRVGALSI